LVTEKKEPWLQNDLNKAIASYTNNKPVLASVVVKNGSYKYNAKSDAKAKQALLNDAEKNNYESSNLGGAGHADQVVKGDQIKYAPSLSTGLSGLLHGITFVNGVPYNNVSTVFNGKSAVKEPMYVIFDGSELNMSNGGVDFINPGVVASVEVLSSANASIYGNEGGSGVLIITSRKNQQVAASSLGSLGSLSFKASGFYVAREFYSPKYNTVSGNNKPDLRSTIMWVPELTTGKDGNASFEFYNADGQGTCRVVVEGIDDKGNIGRTVYRYKVE
jgi:hypothetical protein